MGGLGKWLNPTQKWDDLGFSGDKLKGFLVFFWVFWDDFRKPNHVVLGIMTYMPFFWVDMLIVFVFMKASSMGHRFSG